MSSENFIAAILKSSLLHIFLGAALFLSVDFSTKKNVTETQNAMNVIEAVAIDQAQLQRQMDRIRDQKSVQRALEEQRVKELENRAKNALDKRKQEENKLSNIDKQRKQSEAEKQKALKAAEDAKKKLEEEKRRAKQAEAEAEAARQKRIKEEKALKDAELERQLAVEKAEQEARMKEQLQQEQAKRSAARQRAILTERQKYEALIKQTIQRNLIVDSGMKGKSCRLNIRLAASGFVTSVKVLNGDAILCRAAEGAVLKAETLPVSSEPDVFSQLKDINLTVEPDL